MFKTLLKALGLKKSNYGPKGGGQYTAHHNQKRKQANAGDQDTGIQGIKVKSGANASGGQGKQKLNAEVRELHAKNKKQPVKIFSEEEKAAYTAKLAAQQPKKLAASEPGMRKGAMKRLAPFKPQSLDTPIREEMETWQDDQPKDARENLAEHGMTREAKMRALHKLHSSTAVRKNPVSGEREFLLHRGMSGQEHTNSVKNNGVIHHDTATSWSPHYATGQQFRDTYQDLDGTIDDGKIASAWIPERHIRFVPKQHGTWSGDPNVPPKKNHYEDEENVDVPEHEIIVEPHRSKLVDPQELNVLTHGQSTDSIGPQNIHEKINFRGRRAANKPAAPPSNVVQLKPKPAAAPAEKPKKLAASDPMGMYSTLSKMEHPGKLKDPQFKKLDRAVDSAGRAHDRKPTADSQKKLSEAHEAREKHIEKNPHVKDHLNRLNSYMNEKYGGNRPMRKAEAIAKAHKFKADPEAYFSGDKHFPIGNLYFRRPEHNTIYPETVEEYSKKKVLPALGGRTSDTHPDRIDMQYWRKVSDKHPHNPKYPTVFIDDGHHRATAAAASGTEWVRVTPSGVHNQTYLDGGHKGNPATSRKGTMVKGAVPKQAAPAQPGASSQISQPQAQKPGENKSMDTSMGHHIIFSAENSPYPDKVKSKASHAEVLQFLKDKGEDAHEVQGHYGSPEKSIIVHNPKKPDHIKRLAHVLGQESVIHSNGQKHRLEYLHGPNAGKYAEGTGTVWHAQKPNDFYTSLPDGRHFTHNLDFDNLKDVNLITQANKRMGLK